MKDDMYKSILAKAPFGYAYHKIILNDNGNPIDYEFIEVNSAFENITGLKAKDIIGNTVCNVIPNIRNGNFDWIAHYGDVALNAREHEFEQFSEQLNKWYKVHASSPRKGFFVTIFTDISPQHKLAGIAQTFLTYTPESINYQYILDIACEIAGAKYASFNVFEENGRDFSTVAFSGLNPKVKKTIDKLGLNFIGKKWDFDPIRQKKINNQKVTIFKKLSDLIGTAMPQVIVDAIAGTFNVSTVALVKTERNGAMVGDFTLVFTNGHKLQNQPLLETYADMTGLLLDRLNQERKTSNEQKKLEQITSQITDIVWRTDLQLNNTYVSPSVELILGFKVDEYLKLPLEKRHPTHYLEMFQSIFQEELENEKKPGTDKQRSRIVEIEHFKSDGSIIPIEVNVSFIRDLAGKPVGIQGVTRDITERKQAEEALRENEIHFRNLADTGQALIWTSGLDKKCNYFNQPWLDFTGRTIEQELGDGWAEGVHPEDLQRCFEIYVNAFDRREKFSMDYRIRHVSGEYRWIQDDGTPRYNSKNEFIGYIGHCLDVTESKKAETELRESEERYRTTLFSIGDGVITTDTEGRIKLMNPIAEQLTGFTQNEATGKALEDVFRIINENTREHVEVPVRRVLREGAIVGLANHTLLIAKDGTERPIADSGAPIRNENGDIIGVVLVFRDQTEERKAEKSLYESQAISKTIIESIPGTFYMIDANGKYFGWNAYQRDEIVGQPENMMHNMFAIDTIHPDDRQIVGEKITNVLMNGIEEIVEGRVLLKGGPDYRWFLMTGRQMLINGSPVLIGTGIDTTERKQAEEKIKEQSSLIRIASEKAKLGGWNVILSENRSYWSDQVAAIHEMPAGYAPLVQEGINFYAPEWHDKITQVFTDCAEKGIPYDEELEIITASGKRVWVRTIGEAVRDENGKIFKVQGAFQDISEKRLNEEKVREKDIQFRKLSANVPDLIYQFTRKPDGSYCVPIASEGIKNIFGCAPEEVFDDFTPIANVLYPEDAPRVIEDIEYSAKHLTYFTCEFRVQIPGKDIQWIYSRSNPEKMPDGSITWYGFNVDITERKKAEEALHLREAMLNKIFDVLPVGLWLADKEGKLIRSNAKGREIWGAEPLVGQDQYGVFKARSLPSGKELGPQDWALVKTVQEGVTVMDEMLEIDTFDGMKKVILNYTAPITDKSGNVDGAIIVNQDITDRKLAEDALIKQNSALSNLNQFSIELSMHQFENNIEAYITKKIKEISGAEVTTFNEYNALEKTTSLLHIEMEQGMFEKLVVLLGKGIKSIKSPISDDVYTEIVSKRIGLHKSLFEASFGAISRPVSTAIQSMLNVDRFIGLAYIVDGKLFGTSLLAMGKGVPDPPNEILENFINLAALAIKRKQVEMELRKLSQAVEQSPAAVVITNLQGQIEYVNPKFTQITGFTPIEAKGQKPSILKSGELPPEIYTELWKTINAGKLWQGEFHNKKKNGELFWEAASISPIVNSEGKITHFIAVKEDITERKRTEILLKEKSEKIEAQNEELRKAIEKAEESELKFREMAEMLPQIVFECDLNGVLTYVNKFAHKLSGYTEQDSMIGKSTLDFYIPEDRERALNSIKMRLSGEKVSTGNEYTMVRKDGSEFNVLVYSNPILKNNKPIGLRGIIVDITDIKQTEQELIKAKNKAEESDRLKSAFLANMSHEIRTPMNGILGFLSLLKEPNLNEAARANYISIVNKSGDRLLDTINDIIEVSKIEAGDIQVDNKEIDLYNFLSYYYDFFLPQAKEKRLLFKQPHYAVEKDTIVTDKSKLDSILTNLIKNAFKFTDNGIIEFGCRQQGSHDFLFFVKDTGKGVSPEKVNTIFERFMQEDISLTRGHEGSGLGLSIAKSYVEALGGKIWIDTELGKGSCFYFTIPAVVIDENSKNTPSIHVEINENTLPQLPQHLKLLIAEDDDISFMFIEAFLEPFNYEIVRCVSGREAVNYCKENPDTDIILMDIKMPDMDGLMATKEIRQFNKKVFIIAQTAYALSGAQESAIDAGCNEFLSKPIRQEHLINLFEKYKKTFI